MKFVKIASITPAGQQHVYDLSMADGEDPSFIANGIVVHNSYAAAESAYSTFLETQNTYRNHLTNSVFDSTLFPLIAVANGLYKKDTPASKMVQRGQISQFLMHANNRASLNIPQLVWHKSLEAAGEENKFEMLEQASEKGVPVPLKAWMAAAGMDVDSLLKDLKEDGELRARLAQYTGKDTSHEGEEQVDEAEEASMRPTTQSINSGALGRRALLSRNFGEPEQYTIGKTGKKQHIVHNPRGKDRDNNAQMAKISARAEKDEAYRMQLAKANLKKFGYSEIPGAGSIPVSKGR